MHKDCFDFFLAAALHLDHEAAPPLDRGESSRGSLDDLDIPAIRLTSASPLNLHRRSRHQARSILIVARGQKFAGIGRLPPEILAMVRALAPDLPFWRAVDAVRGGLGHTGHRDRENYVPRITVGGWGPGAVVRAEGPTPPRQRRQRPATSRRQRMRTWRSRGSAEGPTPPRQRRQRPTWLFGPNPLRRFWHTQPAHETQAASQPASRPVAELGLATEPDPEFSPEPYKSDHYFVPIACAPESGLEFKMVLATELEAATDPESATDPGISDRPRVST